MSNEVISLSKPSSPRPSTVAVEAPLYPTEIIDLPSHGYFYPETSPLASGKIEVKVMTAREEDILANESLIRSGKVLEKLLEALVVDKSIQLGEMLITDRNALVVAARRLAYGDTYGPIAFRCKGCGQECKESVNLGDIKEKQYDFSNYTRGNNLLQFKLPHSNVNVSVKLMSVNDDAAIDAELTGIKKVNKNASSEVTTRLSHLIKEVGGKKEAAVIRNFVNNMSTKDTSALRKFVRESTPEIDMSFDFKCDKCEYTERADVPITSQFFWPE